MFHDARGVTYYFAGEPCLRKGDISAQLHWRLYKECNSAWYDCRSCTLSGKTSQDQGIGFFEEFHQLDLTVHLGCDFVQNYPLNVVHFGRQTIA